MSKLKLKLTGKQLRAIGFPEGPVISVAINVKDIEMVMQSQLDLVEIAGKFTPKIVKMDGAVPGKRN